MTTATDATRLKTADTIFVYLFYLGAFSLPWLRPQWYGIVLAAITLSWFFTNGPRYLTANFRALKIAWLFVAVFLVDVAGLLHTQNINYGMAHLETEMPLLIFPVVIFSSAQILSITVIRNGLVAFVAGVITLNLASLAFISYDMWDPHRLEANVIIAHNSIVRIHPVFLSVFISFSLLFVAGTYFPLESSNRNKLGWVLFSCIVLSVYLFWLNSRVGIAGFIVAAFFYAIYSLRKAARLFACAGIVAMIALLMTVPFSRERFYGTPAAFLSPNHVRDPEDYSTRTIYLRGEIYNCSFYMLEGPELLYGYGTGDFKDVLQQCYAAKNYTIPLEKKLDEHSEYLAQVHRTGVFGLLLFLLFLVVPFYYALRFKSPLYAAFIILFAITAFFETIFSSQKGVTFFALFSPLLFIYSRQLWEMKKDQPLNNIS